MTQSEIIRQIYDAVSGRWLIERAIDVDGVYGYAQPVIAAYEASFMPVSDDRTLVEKLVGVPDPVARQRETAAAVAAAAGERTASEIFDNFGVWMPDSLKQSAGRMAYRLAYEVAGRYGDRVTADDITREVYRVVGGGQ